MVGMQEQSSGGRCQAVVAVVPGLTGKGAPLSRGNALQGGSSKAVCKGGKHHTLQAKCLSSAVLMCYTLTAILVCTDIS